MLKDVLANMPKLFDEVVLARGKQYQLQGKILSVRMSEGLIKGRVKGSKSQLYDVHINLRADASQLARCTCPYTINCKHAAACLFEIQQQRKIKIPPQSTPPKRPMMLDVANMVAKLDPEKTSMPYEIHYVINFAKSHRRGIPVKLFRIKKLKSGDEGKPVEMIREDDIRGHLSAQDQILAMKLLSQPTILDKRNQIKDVDTLKQVIDTGNAYVQTGPYHIKIPLSWGDTIQADLGWILHNEGNFELSLHYNNKPVKNLFLWRPPFYFDDEHYAVHYVQSAESPETLRTVLSHSAVPVESVPNGQPKTEMHGIVIPEIPAYEIVYKTAKPTIHVTFHAVSKRELIPDASTEYGEYIFSVVLAYQYEGNTIPFGSDSDSIYEQKDLTILSYPRDREGEEASYKTVQKILQLREPGPGEKPYLIQQKEHHLIPNQCPNEHSLNEIFNRIIPLLQEKGYITRFQHDIFQKPVDIEDLEWFSSLSESGSELLSYELGVIVEGKAVNLVPLVVDVLNHYSDTELLEFSDDHRLYLGVNETTSIGINVGRIRPIINFILQFGKQNVVEGTSLQIEKYQAIWLQEMELATAAAQARWQGAEQIREQIKRFLSQDFTVDMPEGCLADLRDYQIRGVNWLQSLRLCHFSGILADDMGLGKTVQTLAHLQIEKEAGRLDKPCLIVAPTSLVMNWFQEAKRFTPDLNVLVFHGSNRQHDHISQYDIVVTTYGLVQRDKAEFLETEFYYLILDEAQFIKNARAKTTLVVQQLKATHRLCLTGTPLENHLGELWSLFHFLMPGFLGTIRQFRHYFQYPIEREQSKERQVELSQRVSPFLLRRTKKEVVTELPDKTVMTQMVEISGGQRDLYEAIRMSMEDKVRQAIADRGFNKSQIVILDALLKMRQACCDPRLIKSSLADMAHGESAKLDLLEDLLTNLIEEGRRVLLFSQFTTMLSLIEERCQSLDIPYLKLTGQTQNRHLLVDKFQEGDVPLFLISLKAGGTGLNLTAADTVIHYDPWWNPAVEDQATDRSHRIGQTNPVFVYRLICAGTVEEAMLEMQDKKRQLTTSVYEQKMLEKQLDMDTVLSLFKPLTSLN